MNERSDLLLRVNGYPLRQLEMSINCSGIPGGNALGNDFIQKLKRIAVLHHVCEVIVAKIRFGGALGSLKEGISVVEGRTSGRRRDTCNVM